MKKFLAIILAVVLTVCASMLPASAVSVDDLPDSAQVIDVMDNGYELVKAIISKVHAIVGGILGVLDKDCPFCRTVHVDIIQKPSTPPAEPSVSAAPKAWDGVSDGAAKDFVTALQATAKKEAAGEFIIELTEDINLKDYDWTPIFVDSDNQVTVNGNGHTIYGLNDMLFSGTWAGKSKLVIRDLTIAESAIVNDPDDSSKSIGVGAFIGWPQASTEVVLENCSLINSTVEGGHWTGGLVGIAAGYSGNDGPVFETLDIINCSVKGSTVKGKGSCGAVIGHATASDWTLVNINGAVVENNTVASTGFAFTRAGSVIGTVGCAGLEKTVNGISHTGGTYITALTESGNTVTSNGSTINRIYGRQGDSAGKLYVDGAEVKF